MTIKAIFFDLGNVLLGFDWKKTVRELARDCPLTPAEIGARLLDTRIVDFELGELTAPEFFGDLRERIEFTGTTAELTRICSDIFFPIDRNIELARDLRRHYPLGIISNTNPSHVELVEQRFDIFHMFRAVIYSCAVGARKPDRRIFDIALQELGVGASEALFVDDLEQNVEAARALGWHVIQFLPDTDLEEAMGVLGVFRHGPVS